MEIKFYKCSVCGNIVCKVEDSGMPLTCCGKQMKELTPGSTDGAVEKHVPMCEIIDNHIFVQVGSVKHPMEEYHHIEFIGVETNKGFHIKYLLPAIVPQNYESTKCTVDKGPWDDLGASPEDMTSSTKCIQPIALFKLSEGEKVISAFEYCNLHGMFKLDL